MTVYLFSPTENRLQRLFASYPERSVLPAIPMLLVCIQSTGGKGRQKAERGPGRCLIRIIATCILPGSVGQPRDAVNRHAKYLLWDRAEGTLEVRAVAYDVEATVRILGERRFPVVNARGCYEDLNP
jgi:hypothetical protein